MDIMEILGVIAMLEIVLEDESEENTERLKRSCDKSCEKANIELKEIRQAISEIRKENKAKETEIKMLNDLLDRLETLLNRVENK